MDNGVDRPQERAAVSVRQSYCLSLCLKGTSMYDVQTEEGEGVGLEIADKQ